MLRPAWERLRYNLQPHEERISIVDDCISSIFSTALHVSLPAVFIRVTRIALAFSTCLPFSIRYVEYLTVQHQ